MTARLSASTAWSGTSASAIRCPLNVVANLCGTLPSDERRGAPERLIEERRNVDAERHDAREERERRGREEPGLALRGRLRPARVRPLDHLEHEADHGHEDDPEEEEIER